MKYYDLVYRNIFQVFYKKWPTDIPQWNSNILLSLIIVLNVGWIATILIHLFGVSEIISKTDEVIEIAILGLILYLTIIVFNYLRFIKSNRFKDYAADFNSLESKQKINQFRKGSIIVLIGYILPIIMIITLINF